MQESELTWADKLIEKGWKKGRKEGREIGVVDGKRQTLLRQLAAKFGKLPKGTAAKVEALSARELDSVLGQVLTAKTLKSLGVAD